MSAPDPHGSNTLGSTTILQRATSPEAKRRSNWGFAITMLGIIAGLALLAWGMN